MHGELRTGVAALGAAIELFSGAVRSRAGPPWAALQILFRMTGGSILAVFGLTIFAGRGALRNIC